MVYRIWLPFEPHLLRAELRNRETIEETQRFLQAVLAENRRYRRPSILVQVSASKSVFHVEQHGLIEYFKQLADTSISRIALVGDTPELRLSHDYLELISRQRGLNVRSFATEAAALRWLDQRARREERRNRAERRDAQLARSAIEQRSYSERRGSERRGSAPAARMR